MDISPLNHALSNYYAQDRNPKVAEFCEFPDQQKARTIYHILLYK